MIRVLGFHVSISLEGYFDTVSVGSNQSVRCACHSEVGRILRLVLFLLMPSALDLASKATRDSIALAVI